MNFPLDKQAHALSGAVAVFALAYLISMPLCLLFCLAQAIGKEIYDYCHPDIHTCDIWDAIATMSGGAAAAAFILAAPAAIPFFFNLETYL